MQLHHIIRQISCLAIVQGCLINPESSIRMMSRGRASATAPRHEAHQLLSHYVWLTRGIPGLERVNLTLTQRACPKQSCSKPCPKTGIELCLRKDSPHIASTHHLAIQRGNDIDEDVDAL